MSRLPSRWRQRIWRPRSVRGRLVATYTVVAIVLATGGFGVFVVLLNRGLDASVNATLQGRVAPLVTSVANGPPGAVPDTGLAPPEHSASAAARPGTGSAGSTGGTGANTVPHVYGFSIVYQPDGTIVQADPATLRVSPLTATQLERAGKGAAYFTVGREEDELRVLAVPVTRADGTWIVAVGSNVDVVSDAANKAIRDLLLAVPVLILVAAVGAWLLSGAALRPVDRLRSDAARLGAHDPESRLRVPETADELARLAETFNGLLDRLQNSLARQRNLVADAGHELRTPLAVLRTELDLADRPNRSRDDLADAITHARLEVDRLCQLAEDLLFLARADEHGALIASAPIDLTAVVNDAARAARAAAGRKSISLVTEIGEPAPVRGDPSALRRALDNLVSNALRATPTGGTVTVSTERSGWTATVTVADTGPGFPQEFLAHAFERFRRPDSSRTAVTGGAGLGLAIVAEIVRAHHGAVHADNRPGGGAVVTITLPVPASADPLAATETAASI